MDYQPRRKKSDKAHEKKDRNGGYSTKHIRIAEELLEKRLKTSSGITHSKK